MSNILRFKYCKNKVEVLKTLFKSLFTKNTNIYNKMHWRFIKLFKPFIKSYKVKPRKSHTCILNFTHTWCLLIFFFVNKVKIYVISTLLKKTITIICTQNTLQMANYGDLCPIHSYIHIHSSLNIKKYIGNLFLKTVL